jgi:hypothetical protein
MRNSLNPHTLDRDVCAHFIPLAGNEIILRRTKKLFMLATAVVTEVATTLLEVVADLIKLLNGSLRDVTLVDTGAVFAHAAAAVEVVVADLLGDVSVGIARHAGLALAGGTLGATTTLGALFDVVLGDVAFVDTAALLTLAALAGEVVFADLGGDISVGVADVVLGDVASVSAAALVTEAAAAGEVVPAFFLVSHGGS